MPLNLLSDARLKTLAVGDKPYKVADGGGLYLLVKPNGARLWRLKYRFAGVERLLALGVYPEVSLRRAREKRDEARRSIDKNIDPNVARQAKRESDREVKDVTLGRVAQEWFDHYVEIRQQSKRPLRPATIEKLQWLLNLDAYRQRKDNKVPHPLRALSDRVIRTITRSEVANVFHGLKRRNKIETAHRTLRALQKVFRFALGTGRIETDPVAVFANSADPRDTLPPLKHRHHAALTDPRQVGSLLLAIESYQGQPATQAAFRLAPYLFVRPVELRTMEWKELDLSREDPSWRMPARTKMHKEHIVPLPRQAVAILREIHALTGPKGYVFPAITNPNRPLSENTITAALRRMGYTREEMTNHGFRTMASTLLREEGWDSDLVERQLNHAVGSDAQQVYDKSVLLPQRRDMMQAWADYLDGLRQAAIKSQTSERDSFVSTTRETWM